MLTTDRQKATCAKYSKRDENGRVHCSECPLVIDRDERTCRNFMHWDRHLKGWVMDEDKRK